MAFALAFAFSERSPSPKLALAFSKTGLSFSFTIALAKIGSLARPFVVGHGAVLCSMPLGSTDETAIVALAFSTVVLFSRRLAGLF